MSSSLEKLCRQNDLLYTSQDGYLKVTIANHFPEASHEVNMYAHEDGKIGFYIKFPVERREIDDVDDFCTALQGTFLSEAGLSFNMDEPHFYIYDLIENKDFGEYVKKLAHDCDIAKPLFESVGRHGYCHYQGIWLARIMPSRLGTYAH